MKNLLSRLDLKAIRFGDITENLSIEEFEEFTENYFVWPNIPAVTEELTSSEILAKGANWIIVRKNIDSATQNKIYERMENECEYGAPIFYDDYTIDDFR